MKKIIISLCLILSLFIFASIGCFLVYPLKYQKYIKSTSEKYGINEVLVASIIFAESRFDENAKSNKGAIGLMQLMPLTAEVFYEGEEKFDEKILYNPKINIEIGVKFLKYLFDKYQDEVTVLACYNAGEKNVLEWKGESRVLEKTQIKFKETLNYIKKVQNVKKYYKFRF